MCLSFCVWFLDINMFVLVRTPKLLEGQCQATSEIFGDTWSVFVVALRVVYVGFTLKLLRINDG